MIYTAEVIYGDENAHTAEHETAYGLLQEAVLREYGIKTDESDISKTELGKPYFHAYPRIKFSLTHCRGLAACLISGGECGIDAEPLRSPKGAEKRVCSEAELDILRQSAEDKRDIVFTALWTLKEAYSKAVGRGIAAMNEVHFRGEGGRIISDDAEHSYYLRGFGEYVIAVCLPNGETLINAPGEEICPL